MDGFGNYTSTFYMWNAASYIGIKSANMDETKQRFLSAIVSRDIHQSESEKGMYAD